jgi:hypothetical protein
MKTPQFKINGMTLSMVAAAAALVAGCGGGGSSSPQASAVAPQQLGTMTTSGTVTGFGSVIVDGVRIDDRNVVAGVEQEDSSVVNAELKIGQHVDVEHDANLLATMVRITSELKGSVDSVSTTAGTLSILGQTVAINTVVANGPLTVFEAPYTSLADIKAGDTIEVHGLIKVDATGTSSLQATRIEKAAVAAFSRVRGDITDLSTTASTFKVGTLLVSYAGATVKPSAAALANGADVVVSIPANKTFTGAAVNAAVVKVKNRHEENQDKEGKLGGPITKFDAAGKTFTVDGVKVDASKAVFEQSNRTFADLSEGVYVRVKGSYSADGSLVATTIVIRSLERESGREVELHGSILNFKSNADFTLRDIAVDASTAKLSCPGVVALTNGQQVEVEGHLSAAGKLIAVEVKCEAPDDKSIVERDGVASAVDTTAKTLTIGTLPNAVKVNWTATTLFINVDPATLSGKTVEVEGTLAGAVFTATKIKLERS